MIKKIAVSICLLFSLVTFAQEGTSSPYSFYGIGDVKFKGTVENRSMGGLTIFPDSIHLNIQNPASYASLRYTTFSLGGSFSSTKLQTETQNEKAQRVSLDYFAVGFPMGKLGAAFGVLPYTSVGYRIHADGLVNGLHSDLDFTGTGGINKVFIGAGYQFSPKWSFGADVSYNFGRIETTSRQSVFGVQYASREISTSDIGGFSFSAGLQYQTAINEKLKFYSGLTYATQGNLRSMNEREIAVVQKFVTGGEVVVGTPITVNAPNSTLTMPSRVSFGAGLGEQRKWRLGAEVTYQQSSDQENRFTDIDNVSFENAFKYSVGGYIIPKYNSFSNYFNRVTYRAGLRYEDTGLIVSGKSIEDTGVTLGLGLPVGGTFSNVNIGFEYGKRGTIYGGLVRETYANVSIGLSFNDRWFVKRKYD